MCILMLQTFIVLYGIQNYKFYPKFLLQIIDHLEVGLKNQNTELILFKLRK